VPKTKQGKNVDSASEAEHINEGKSEILAQGESERTLLSRFRR